MKDKTEIHRGFALAVQAILALTDDPDGLPYYCGPIDGQIGQQTTEAARRMLERIAPAREREEPADLSEQANSAPDENLVLVFSLKADGDRQLSAHFKVREFACQDGSDAVFIHPLLPVWAEQFREINGPFSPNSAYRTVSHNKAIGGASYSRHCQGTAMDIPAVNAAPQELYEAAEKILGQSGGLGLYPWGIHVDTRKVKTRWRE